MNTPYNCERPNEGFESSCNIDTPYKCPLNPSCSVKWNERSQLFVCECHQCKWDLKGNLIKGPAQKGLTC